MDVCPSRAELEVAFRSIAGDSDTLDKDQFVRLCYGFYMSPTNGDIDDMFKKLDVNNDHKLTFDEADDLIKMQWAPIPEIKQAFVDSLHKCRTKTGPIDRDELRAILMRGSDEALTDEDIEYCFVRLDLDGDKELSEEELANILFKMDALSRQVSKISRREKSDLIELKKNRKESAKKERKNRSRSRSRSSSRGRKGSGKKGKKDRSRSRSSSNEKKGSERKEKERSKSRSSSRGRKGSGKKGKKNRSRSRSSSNESKKSGKSCKSSKSSRSGSGKVKKDETNQEDNANNESEGNQEKVVEQTNEIENDATGNQQEEQTNEVQAETNKEDAGGEQTDASNIPMTVTGI